MTNKVNGFFCGITFLLTHLLRGVTEGSKFWFNCNPVSTHTPLARCDLDNNRAKDGDIVSTHTPLARCDGNQHECGHHDGVSTHTPLARCDNVFCLGDGA